MLSSGCVVHWCAPGGSFSGQRLSERIAATTRSAIIEGSIVREEDEERLKTIRERAKVLIEETALGTDLGGRFVMVVGDDNIVERRYIEPGPLQEDMTRVVLDGLETGERYIAVGLQRARPGMPVTPKEAVGR